MGHFYAQLFSAMKYVFLPTGLILVLLGVSRVQTTLRLLRKGVRTTATVVDVHQKTTTTSSSYGAQSRATTYYAILEFAEVPPSNKIRHLPCVRFSCPKIGSTSPIIYDPSNSSIAREMSSVGHAPIILLSLGGFFLTMALVGFLTE